VIENVKAGRVKSAAALARKKDRIARQRFLVEGPQAVRELLAHRADLAEVVYTSLGTEPWQHEIDRLASEHGVEIERATDAVIAAISDTVTPQGVVAIARIDTDASAHWRSSIRSSSLAVVLHDIRDPGNAGTVLRAADAAGAGMVVFSGQSIDPWHPKVVRATTGSLFHLSVVTVPDLEDAIAGSREAGLTVLAADVRGEDLNPADPALADPVAWVFGNEARGLSDTERALADRAIRLPIFGAAESLNLATAASVLLYQSAFAQRGS